MKTLTVICRKCRSITTVAIEDEYAVRISNVIDVIDVMYDKLRCPKCHTPFDSEDDGLPNLIPFDSNLIPTFLELHRKGYMISLSPADEGESISIYISINKMLESDVNLSQYRPLGLSIRNLGGTIATCYSMTLPLILDDTDIDELYAWAVSLKDLEDMSVNTTNRMDTYEILFSDLIEDLEKI